MINNNQKQIQTKLTKGLLDMIILQYLEKESMHGYQSHHPNTQRIRRILRTQHHIPTPRNTRKKRIRKKHLEHEHPKTKKGI
jgi:hypothetical protein